uniref:Reverse transcriptase/retrotransposon-derived protein RNase H-like domain-containing protein n=1 Tax=Sinocyclocheilus grahami TaxID=75366 RepID=A0A672K8Z9_SINGR
AFSETHLGRQEVKFLGHIISESGVRPDPDQSGAGDERTIHHQRNSQLPWYEGQGTEGPSVKKIHWGWGKAQQEAFSELKLELSSTPVLALYNPNKELKLSADASSYGLGEVLLLKEEELWKPVAYASCSLTPTEQQYAQGQKEALVLTWGSSLASDSEEAGCKLQHTSPRKTTQSPFLRSESLDHRH